MWDGVVATVVGDDGPDVEQPIDTEFESQMVDEEVRGLLILPTATVSLTAALGADSIVAIEGGGGRGLVLVGLEGLLGFERFGGWNSLGEELRRAGEAGFSTGVRWLFWDPLLVRAVGLGADLFVWAAGRSTCLICGEEGLEPEFDADVEDRSDSTNSTSGSRRLPGKYRSSSSISKAAPGFITRTISSNRSSH